MALSSPARADSPDASSCVDAYSKAQTLRNERKLVEARAALLVCVQPTCKEFIVKDCTDWLGEVKTALPTIVPVAVDPTGNALVDVKVSMDGAQLVAKIDGRSVEVNPGPHAFVFEMADGTKAQKNVLVAEGEHEKQVSVTIGKAAAGAPAGGAAAPAGAAAAGGASPGDATSPTDSGPHKSSPLKLVGMVTAGLGVVSLGVGGVFALTAMSDKSAAKCSASSVCPDDGSAQKLKDAGSAATMSTVFFIAGGVLAAGGVALWLGAPSGSSSKTAVQIAPTIGLGSAGLTMQGGF
jgi:hypothetical protein